MSRPSSQSNSAQHSRMTNQSIPRHSLTKLHFTERHSLRSILSAALFLILMPAVQVSAQENSCKISVRKVFNSKTPADSLILPQDEDGCTIFNVEANMISKGTVIDFNATVNPTENCNELYVLEYLDGKKWHSCDTVLFYRADDNATRQSTTIMQTFRLNKTARHGLKLRLRPLREKSAPLSLAKYGYTAEYVQNFGKGTAKDTTDILCIGNSFTYVDATPFFLKEIAWNEGHLLRIHASVKGGQTFGQHLKLPLTDFAIHADHYDYALLQNQSQASARYASDSVKYEQIAEDMLELMDKVLENSPECKIVLESTWAFSSGDFGGFGSYGNFDSLLEEGTSMLIEKAAEAFPETEFIFSPIGRAFAEVRRTSSVRDNQSPDDSKTSGINLYDKDNKHQSIYGAYLKACVNYLILFGDGKGFTAESDATSGQNAYKGSEYDTDRKVTTSRREKPSGTSIDCGLNHEIAAALRAAAERIVCLIDG